MQNGRPAERLDSHETTIDAFYNTRRLHSSYQFQSHLDFEHRLR